MTWTHSSKAVHALYSSLLFHATFICFYEAPFLPWTLSYKRHSDSIPISTTNDDGFFCYCFFALLCSGVGVIFGPYSYAFCREPKPRRWWPPTISSSLSLSPSLSTTDLGVPFIMFCAHICLFSNPPSKSVSLTHKQPQPQKPHNGTSGNWRSSRTGSSSSLRKRTMPVRLPWRVVAGIFDYIEVR